MELLCLKERPCPIKNSPFKIFFTFELQLNGAWIHDWDLMVATHDKLSLIKFPSYYKPM